MMERRNAASPPIEGAEAGVSGLAPGLIEPNPFDVLLGRGRGNQNHIGNKRYQGSFPSMIALLPLSLFFPPEVVENVQKQQLSFASRQRLIHLLFLLLPFCVCFQ
jgi:hypothetical protein